MTRENSPSAWEFYGYAREFQDLNLPDGCEFAGVPSYTRAWAIEDGVVEDVSDAAKAAGFAVPVSLTRDVWDACVKASKEAPRPDEAGWLGEILRACPRVRGRVGSAAPFQVRLRDKDGEGSPVTLQAVWELDVFEGPCITISFPDEG